MIHWLTSLPVIIGATLSAGVAVIVGLTAYYVAHIAVGRKANKENRELAANMFRIIATLLSLLLSLTFADVRVEIGMVRSSVETEAGQLADIYKDLSAFESVEATAVRVQLLDYVDAVIEDEWQALQRGEVSERVVEIFHGLEYAILNLEATTPLQQILHSRLVDDVDALSTNRAARLIKRDSGTPIFLYVAILGFLWTMAFLSVYAPAGKAITYLSAYSAFFGIVIYIILALSNYFEGIGGVTPETFEFLSEFFARS